MRFKWPKELNFMSNRKVIQRTTTKSLVSKTAIISGATSGVGLESMKELAKAGAHIVMVVRNKDKAENVKQEVERDTGATIDIVLADFSDLDSVRNAATYINKEYNKIDILINSAGIHSTKKRYNKDGIEMVFCVNHLATFLFTCLLLDKLKQSAPSRIIQVNSEGHRFNGLNVKDVNFRKRIYTGLRGYGASKTAQLMTVWELADQLEGTGVTINAMHPGAVKTNIGSNNGWLYRWFFKHFTWHFLKDPSISGKAVYFLAAADELAAINGKFFNLTIEEMPAKHALNRTKGKLIWDLSIKMAGLNK